MAPPSTLAMPIERAVSPGGSSATSTASCSRYVHVYNKAPQQPQGDDQQTWSNFLAAYQKGEWERTNECTSKCTKMARKVQIENGSVIDNYDFFERFKYLAAPPVPKEKSKARRSALLRHGFTGPQTRPSVNRYVRHAKSVFKCDFVSVSIASSDDRSTLIIGSEGSSCAQLIATNTTMCGHAMLLDEDEVFVVPDLTQDWRFRHLLSGKDTDNMHFYASAPILLSASLEEEEATVPVHVGRLTVMRRNAWPGFGESEAEILLDIARMAQEALENEYLQAYATKVQKMQRETARLSYRLNQMADSEVFSQQSAQENRKGILFCESSMQLPIDLLRETVGATNVTAIDVSNMHVSASKSFSVASGGSPRSSINYGVSSPPSSAWMARSSSSTLSPSSVSEPQSPVLSYSLFPSEDGMSFYAESPSISNEPDSPTHKRRPSRIQMSTSSSFSYSLEDETASSTYSPASTTTLRRIASSGNPEFNPNISGSEQCAGVCAFFTSLKRKGLFTKPQMWHMNGDDEESEDGEEGVEDSYHVKNTLSSLLSPHVKLCVAVPVFSNDRTQPLFLVLITFDYNKAVVPAERYFSYSIGVILAATAFRAQASMSDRAQLDFIRSVQHELRTPLNAVLGITDLLRQNFVDDDGSDKLDMTQDGVLANLLESIRLSGVTLSTILDDVLDFGAVTGLGSGKPKAAMSVEEVDLEREVEDICLDELEHISLHERQDHNLRIGHRGYSAVPTLIVKVSNEVRTRFRSDRGKLRKMLSKFISNALRYSDEHDLVEVIVQPTMPARRDVQSSMTPSSPERWIDFIIQDTGMGMTKEFLNNSLLKPFIKADSFSQGVGLGVTISASLISQLGGRFHVQSELGKGTRVHISLPFGVSAPLRAPVRRTPSHFAPAKPLQIHTAAFSGFDNVGHRAVQRLISERLEQNQVRIVEPGEHPELVILQESVLFGVDKTGHIGPASETPSSRLPHPSGPRARTLIVTRTAMRTRSSSALDGQTVWYIRPPFSRESLDLMDEFLREESPVVLRRVPTPTRTANQNLKKVSESKQTIGESGSLVDKLVSPSPKKAIGAMPSTDGADSANVSVVTGTTAASSVPPLVMTDAAQKLEHNPDTSKVVPASRTGDSSDDKPFCILVVEDNPVNMKLITTLLTRERYTFVEAKDGVEAVEQYKKHKPSVVLLDISLPLLDGFGACLQMRQHDLPHVPKIIAVTALSSTEDKVRGLEQCGMDDWRTKPLSIKTLRVDLVAWKREWHEAWSGDSSVQGVEADQEKMTLIHPQVTEA
jgi:signal transduction histidine kinase/FixJ family two-component response regulator